jgi:hypothetical protein
MQHHDPTWDCNICVASASSSSEPELAPHHRAADAQQRGASATRSWPFFTKSWEWMPSPTTGDLHNTSPCRRSPVRGMAIGVSAVRLPSSRTTARQHHRHTGQHATTTDAPTKARTSAPTPTLTPRRTSGGCRIPYLLQPCCYVAAQRQRPPRSDEYARN